MKMLGEWFWTDRWVGSSAFLLPIEQRGLYREMLTQAWRRECRLPNNHEAIRRVVGCTLQEWKRTWPAIKRYWRVDGDELVNNTQLEVWAECLAKAKSAEARGRKGGLARAQALAKLQAKPEAKLQAKLVAEGLANGVANGLANSLANSKPPDPDPVPPSERSQREDARARDGRPEARSKRPIFKGSRIVVFEWMLDDIRQMLGPNFEDFGLDEWFFAIDAKAEKANVVIPKRDGGAWVYAELLEEASRRGLTISGRNDSKNTAEDNSIWNRFPHAWQCGSCGEIHEGSAEQAKEGVCLKVAHR